MIQIKTKAFRLMPVNVIWFADKPQKWQCLYSYYKQSTHVTPVAGYHREDFFTKIIDLTTPLEIIETGFDQKTAYEIRRAIKDGVTTTIETDLKHFVNFYNLFAKTKQLPRIGVNINKYKSRLVITKAVYDAQDIVMHAYLVDNSMKRVRLLYSASLFRNEQDTQLKAIVGRANRLLHFKDMCLFKQQGFDVYDLGGYAVNTNDEALIRINYFKDSFGGTLVHESDYLPFPALVLSFFNKMFKS
jgi:lipid II:glycine glycyltransferase (peptidoglycan interpeptide bridge formation enzyme)